MWAATTALVVGNTSMRMGSVCTDGLRDGLKFGDDNSDKFPLIQSDPCQR